MDRDGQARPRIIASADVFVFRAYHDTFGASCSMKRLWASGVPIAAFRSPARRDVCGNNHVWAHETKTWREPA